jgi:hypothetical protein
VAALSSSWVKSSGIDKVGRKKTTCGSGSRPTLFFLPTLFFSADPIIFSTRLRWLRAAHTVCQNGVCCHTNYWTKLPKFVHWKYASLVNIDVGTLLQIAQQKNAKTMKKILKKKISDLPNLIFWQYETGTTGIFFMPRVHRGRALPLKGYIINRIVMHVWLTHWVAAFSPWQVKSSGIRLSKLKIVSWCIRVHCCLMDYYILPHLTFAISICHFNHLVFLHGEGWHVSEGDGARKTKGNNNQRRRGWILIKAVHCYKWIVINGLKRSFIHTQH